MVGGNFGDFCALAQNQIESKSPYSTTKRQSVYRVGP